MLQESRTPISSRYYDENYYENGIVKGVSCYQNYRWLPEMTIPMCSLLCEELQIWRSQTILDFGCAKGYMVKAFRLLGRAAWGYDTSEYAYKHRATDYLVSNLNDHYKWVIAKDVFEHISEPELDIILDCLDCENIFVVVPLGNGERYIDPKNELDQTHILREPLEWWEEILRRHFKIVTGRYEFGDLKRGVPDRSCGFLTGMR